MRARARRREQGVARGVDVGRDDHGDDEPVDAQHAGHDHGAMDFITSSGRITPMEAMPTPDLAVPYAAPKPAWSVGEGRK